MQYITFATESDFDSWNAEMDILKGFDGTGATKTYTDTTEGMDGVFYAAMRTNDVTLLETMNSPYVDVVDTVPTVVYQF